MKIHEARRILGKESEKLTDEQIQAQISTAKFFAEVAFDIIQRRQVKKKDSA